MNTSAPAVPLGPLAEELLAGPNFATVATRSPKGALQQTIVWVAERNGKIVFSTVKGRAKHRNLENDNNISVLVADRDNPYRYVEFRGVAAFEAEGAGQLIDALSRRYTGEPWTKPDTDRRLNVVVEVSRVIEYRE